MTMTTSFSSKTMGITRDLDSFIVVLRNYPINESNHSNGAPTKQLIDSVSDGRFWNNVLACFFASLSMGKLIPLTNYRNTGWRSFPRGDVWSLDRWISQNLGLKFKWIDSLLHNDVRIPGEKHGKFHLSSGILSYFLYFRIALTF
jgi:hypothetical protein